MRVQIAANEHKILRLASAWNQLVVRWRSSREALMSMRGFHEGSVNHFLRRLRLIGRLNRLVFSARRWTRETHSWAELVAFAFQAAGGFLEPLQIPTEIEQAMTEVEKLKPRFVLEIGTARGGTFFLFSRAAAANACLVSLDLPAGQWGGGYSQRKTWIFRHLLLQGQSAHFVRANSHDPGSLERVKQALHGNYLDLLYIDGDHSYEGVKADFDMYSSLVRPGGVIIFHDIALHESKWDCHVDRLWSELKGRFPHSEIIQAPDQGWAGIGILQYAVGK
jgi:cephalosporin hydroxylase